MPSSTTKVPIRLDQGGSVLLSLCELTPRECWQHYGVLPSKLVLHLTLLLLTTWMILHDAARWGPYRLASQANVCYFFAPPSCSASLCGATPDLGYGWDNWSNCFVYSTDGLRSAVHGVIHNYYHIQDVALANYGWMMTTTTMGAGEATAGTAVRSNITTSSSNSSLVPQPPILTATLQTAKKDLTDRHTMSYPLTLENLGPLDARIYSQEEIDDFFSRLVAMQINLELTDDLADDDANVCYLWGVEVLYDLQNRAEIAVSQKSYIKGFCDELDGGRKGGGGIRVDENGHGLQRGRRVRRRQDKGQQQQQKRGLQQIAPTTTTTRSSIINSNSTIVSSPPIVGRVYVDPLAVFLSAAIFLVSLWLCLFLLSELHGSLFLLRRAHTLLDNKSKPQPSSTLYRRRSSISNNSIGSTSSYTKAIDWAADVHLGTKFHFFSFWQVLLLSGALLSLTQSLHALHGLNARAPPMVSDAHAAWRGLGAAFLWVYTCRYLHHSDRLYAIVLVINHSVPRVARMLIQVVPLFVGFTWFGVMIFGPYLPRFGSFPQAFATLFCVWNGDALMDVHAELGVWFPGVGFVYLAVFVGVFSYVILNILLVVVQQTLVYVQVHDRGKRRLHRLLVGREEGREGGGEEGGKGKQVKEVVDVEKDFLTLLDLTHGRDATGDFFDEAGVGAGAADGWEGGRGRSAQTAEEEEEARRRQQQGLRQRRGGETGALASSMAAAAAKGSR